MGGDIHSQAFGSEFEVGIGVVIHEGREHRDEEKCYAIGEVLLVVLKIVNVEVYK